MQKLSKVNHLTKSDTAQVIFIQQDHYSGSEEIWQQICSLDGGQLLQIYTRQVNLQQEGRHHHHHFDGYIVYEFCFSHQRFFADNCGEFANLKLDELMSKLGLTVKFGPAFSLCSNGINERNHTAANITIRKLMEDKKVPLSDSLFKAEA